MTRTVSPCSFGLFGATLQTGMGYARQREAGLMSEKGHDQLGGERQIGKVVGRRRIGPSSLEDTDQLLRTAWELRGTDKLVPRGLYRFKTFEEADAWMIQAMARTHALQQSKT